MECGLMMNQPICLFTKPRLVIRFSSGFVIASETMQSHKPAERHLGLFSRGGAECAEQIISRKAAKEGRKPQIRIPAYN